MKKIALACTGGGVKVAVNIGVLRALDELGIKIEAISGASLGSIIALYYLLGYSPEEILKIFKKDIIKFEKFNVLDYIIAVPNCFINGGAKNPKIITEFVNDLQKKEKIKVMKDIEKPFIVPALDISKREVVYYSSKPLKGNLTYFQDREISEAVRSSSALPLLFTPNKVLINNKNHFMLDGGILTNTLISPLKQFSDYVIGVTNKFYLKDRKRVNLFTGFTQTFQSMRRSYLFNEKQQADLWIQIDVKSNKFIGDINYIDYCEKIGYKTVMECAKANYFEKIEELSYV